MADFRNFLRDIALPAGISAAIASSITPPAGAAVFNEPPRIDFKTVYTLSGTCEGLSSPSSNYTGSCSGTLFHMIYRNGRESFAFGAKGQTLISFSGSPGSNSPSVSLVDVDHITVTGGRNTAPDADAHAATGSCALTIRSGNRFAVKCIGHTKGGEFSGSFTSDGNRPTRVDF